MSLSPDIDSERAPEATLAGYDGLCASLLDAAADAQGALLAVKDAASGRYLRVNAAMAAFLGHDPAAVLGRTDADLLPGPLAVQWRAADAAALAQTGSLVSDHGFEWQGVRREFSVLRLASPVDALGRRVVCSLWTDRAAALQRESQLRATLTQLEQLQRAEAALRRELADQALRDQASGLYTRGHFEDQLRREVDLSHREHREFALVLLAIDPPADKVRAMGPQAQDSVLEALGRLIRGGTRAMDASCRYDENSFAVLLSGVGLATAHSRMEGLRRQCATQIVVYEAREINFSVSVGVASFPHTAHTLEDLRASCALALAEAQRRGGNHVALASIRLDRSA